MKLQLSQLINSLGNAATGDAGAFARLRSNAMPLSTSLRMRDVIRRVNEIVADFDAMRIELCQLHGTLNPETNHYDFEGDAQAAFNADFTELLASEVEIPGSRIKISQLLSSMAIMPDDLAALEWLIDDGRTPLALVPDTPESDDILDLGDQTKTAAA